MRGLGLLLASALLCPSLLRAQDSDKAKEKVIGDRLSLSIVAIRNPEGFGTGMLLTEKGLILTNAHVVCSPLPFYVSAVGKVDGEMQQLKFERVTLLGVHPEYDLALLQIDPSERKAALQPLTVSESRLGNGDRIWTMGYPSDVESGKRKVLSSGTVKSTERRLYGDPYIELDLSVYFGNSGGPLVDARGEIVGVVTAMLEDGGALAVPISTAKPERFVPLRQRAPNHGVSTMFVTEAEKQLDSWLKGRGGSIDRAITYFEQALLYDLSNAELYAKFGRFNFLAQRHEFAVAYFVRSLQMEPWRDNGASVYRQLGLSLLSIGKPDDTRVIWVEGLKKYPKDNSILWGELATLLLKEGQSVEAAVSARAALKSFSSEPDQMNALYKKAREQMSPAQLAKLRQMEGALETELGGLQLDAEQARKAGKQYITPEAEKLLRSFSGVQQSGTIDTARLGLRKELPKLDVTDAELAALFVRTRINVARENLRTGRTDAAVDILEDVLKSNPTHPDAEAARDLLRIIKKGR